MNHRILFVATEVHPYQKVGGLADVAAGLPAALGRLGHDVRVLVPATAAALRIAKKSGAKAIASPPVLPGARLLEAPLSGKRVRTWLLDMPGYRVRRGTPYQDSAGRAYGDDAQRYDALARIAAAIAGGRAGSRWQPDVVHCNEWHTGLVPVHLLLQRIPVASVFTIHNLAYQGQFPSGTLEKLELPGWLGHPDAMGSHGGINFMKAALTFSDKLTAVSPRYADEIRTPAFGAGLDALLRRRAADLCGILNGTDLEAWNPVRDAALASAFDSGNLAARRPNRAALTARFGLPADDALLIGMVTRLVPQKGIDILLQALPMLLQMPVRLLILGSGDPSMQKALSQAARRHPQRLGLHVGHDETLARRIYAGCDAFLMPSRFEPCGLSQLYAMRYGALPIVHRTGGLADTVMDASDADDAGHAATGFAFDQLTPEALVRAVARAADAHRNKAAWQRMQRNAMLLRFEWADAARKYAGVYALAQGS